MSKATSLAAFAPAVTAFGDKVTDAAQNVVTDRASRVFLPRLKKDSPKLTGGLRASLERQKAADGWIVGSTSIVPAIVLPGRREAVRSGRIVGSEQTPKNVVQRARRNFRRELARVEKQEVGKYFKS